MSIWRALWIVLCVSFTLICLWAMGILKLFEADPADDGCMRWGLCEPARTLRPAVAQEAACPG